MKSLLVSLILSVLALHVSGDCAPKSEGSHWCYSDPKCGPNSQEWPQLCHNGKRQTPIDLPQSMFPTGMTSLRLDGYRGDHFNIMNNGHTVVINFGGEGPSNQTFNFPDPLLVNNWNQNQQKIRHYRFHSAHFHWGRNDSMGSEHCIAGRCSAMELHLVHYLNDSGSLQGALDSCDENALAVVGLLIDVNPINGSPSSPLAPIVKHLEDVEDGSQPQTHTINELLDFTPMFFSEEMQIYTYKGSLTTPKCNEQVNWYVMRRPALVPKEEIQKFRTQLMDSHGHVMEENHRPLQDRNGRDVILSDVFPYQRNYQK